MYLKRKKFPGTRNFQGCSKVNCQTHFKSRLARRRDEKIGFTENK